MKAEKDMDIELFVDDENRDFYVRLGATIRKTRTERGITLEQMAEIAGIEPAQLDSYESGTFAIPILTLVPILRYMNFPPEFDELGKKI